MPSKPLQKVIEGLQRQWRACRQPGFADGMPVEPFPNRLPDQPGRQSVPRQRPREHHRKRSATASPGSAGRAEDALPPENHAFLCLRMIAIHPTMPIERADPFTVGAWRGFDSAIELLKRFGILYKDHMPWLFHRRKVEDLDELSNQANDLIRAGRWDDAEKSCRRLRELFPDEVEADDRLAQLYQAQKNYAQALPYAQAALDKARGNPDKFDPELVTDLEDRVAFVKGKVRL